MRKYFSMKAMFLDSFRTSRVNYDIKRSRGHHKKGEYCWSWRHSSLKWWYFDDKDSWI